MSPSSRRRAADPRFAQPGDAPRHLHHHLAGERRRTGRGDARRGRVDLFEVIVAGEDAPVKKPAPDAYLLVLEALRLRPEECLAFEDSRNGLLAARAAEIATVVTPSLYTAHETFDGAALVLRDLGDFDLADVDPDAVDTGEGDAAS